MRIYARPLPLDYGDGNDDIGSSSTSGTKKIVHFQRHGMFLCCAYYNVYCFENLNLTSLIQSITTGQGTHNELYKKVHDETGIAPDLASLDPLKNPLLLEHIIDSPLTQKGINQCIEQRPVAKQLNGIELVIVSPLVRALQTAHITFEDHLPSYNNNDASSSEEKSKSVKWIAHEGIREEFGTLLCNKRRPLSETMAGFPQVDYSYMISMEDEDVAWRQYAEMNANENGAVRREELVDISHRAYDFMVDFILRREEKEIAVVGHSHYFHALTNCVFDIVPINNVVPTKMLAMFGQAEIRSFELEFLRCSDLGEEN